MVYIFAIFKDLFFDVVLTLCATEGSKGYSMFSRWAVDDIDCMCRNIYPACIDDLPRCLM